MNTTLAPQVTPKDIGRKFHADGGVRRFPGNTIVCHIAAETALVARLDRLHARLVTAPAAHSYTLLPPSSWHMTLFVGLCDEVRDRQHWPEGLPLDLPLDAADRFVADRLKAAPFAGPMRFRMRVDHHWPLADGIVIGLACDDAAQEQEIRRLRDEIAGRIGLRLPGHDSFGFHITLAYFVGRPTLGQYDDLAAIMAEEVAGMVADLPSFLVGPPEFCAFNDMFAFNRQFYLP
jgi:hypothetical protein